MEKYKSNLKNIRKEAGVTINKIVKDTGISKGTLCAMESETGSNPSLGTIKRLMAYLEISFDTLYPADNQKENVF